MRRLFLFLSLMLFTSPVSAYEQVQDITTPKGWNVWLIESHQLPIISLRLRFNHAGYAYDPATKEGLASLFADMLMEGAGEYDAKQFHRTLDAHAISPEVSVGAEHFNIHLTFLRQHAEKASKLLHAMLHKPHLPEEALTRLKAKINNTRTQRKQEPSYLANRLWEEKAYEGHPLHRDPSGSEQSLTNITLADVQDFFATRLVKDQLTLTMAGDMTTESARKWLDDTLALPTSNVPLPAVLPATKVQNPGQYHRPIASSQASVMFGLNALPRTHPDFYALYVLNHMLGGGSFQSRLTGILREEKGLVYSVYSYLSAVELAPALQGGLATRPEQVEDAIYALKGVFTDFQQGEITSQADEDAKTHIIGALPLKTDKVSKLSSYLMHAREFGLGQDYLQQRAGYFEAVTREDIERVARELLHPEQLVITIAGPENNAP